MRHSIAASPQGRREPDRNPPPQRPVIEAQSACTMTGFNALRRFKRLPRRRRLASPGRSARPMRHLAPWLPCVVLGALAPFCWAQAARPGSVTITPIDAARLLIADGQLDAADRV